MNFLKTLAVAAFFGVVTLASQPAAAQSADDCRGSAWASGVVKGSDGTGGCNDVETTGNSLNVHVTGGAAGGDASAANQVITNAALGTPADSACTTDTATCAVIALVKRALQSLTTLNTTAAAEGVVHLNGSTTTGATGVGYASAASTNSTSVKGSAGTLYGLHLTSTSLTVMYLRMYDSASAPTCSSATNFVRPFAIPPAASAGLVGGYEVKLPPQGVKYTNGIGFCITGGSTSTDNTNATTGAIVNIDYQ